MKVIVSPALPSVNPAPCVDVAYIAPASSPSPSGPRVAIVMGVRLDLAAVAGKASKW